jgi:ribosome-associated toxin RatA of RatAB toxin-antitoxin module
LRTYAALPGGSRPGLLDELAFDIPLDRLHSMVAGDGNTESNDVQPDCVVHLLARSWDRDGAQCHTASRTLGVVLMPERHITVQRRMSASAASVWALYADFPNLASHWSGLRATRAIGDQTSGLGARRRVDLKPIGSMDETVTTWEEGRRIDTQNQPSMSVPFKRARSTLTLEPDDDGTLATFDYRYVPRGGPIGRFTGPLIDKMLTATFTDMLAATEAAALANG